MQLHYLTAFERLNNSFVSCNKPLISKDLQEYHQHEFKKLCRKLQFETIEDNPTITFIKNNYKDICCTIATSLSSALDFNFSQSFTHLGEPDIIEVSYSPSFEGKYFENVNCGEVATWFHNIFENLMIANIEFTIFVGNSTSVGKTYTSDSVLNFKFNGKFIYLV